MKLVTIKPEAKYVMLHAEEGWTTNMPLEDFMAKGNLFAFRHNGEDLTPDHGYPLRFVYPASLLLEKRKMGSWDRVFGQG
nr:molybdopterin-dependent oxidoreductase [Brevibacillus laterosporus]